MKYYPQLAVAGTREHLGNPEYKYEPKLDGIRCIAYVYPSDTNPYTNTVTLLSRTGKDITASFPDVCDKLVRIDQRHLNLVLDGEIICPSSENPLITLCDFQALQTRLQRKIGLVQAMLSAPAKYIAFDILAQSYYDCTTMPWHDRRLMLERLPFEIERTTPITAEHSLKLFDTYTQAGLEGFIAKKISSTYHAGQRHNSWIKIKPTKITTALVGGITHGYGRRKPYFGGLVLGHPTSNQLNYLTYIGTVGSGLTDEELKNLTTNLQPGPNLFIGDKQPTNVKHFLIPTMRARVSYQELTKTNQLRFPTLIAVEYI